MHLKYVIVAVGSKKISCINKLIMGDGIVRTTCSNQVVPSSYSNQVVPSSTVPFKRDSKFVHRDDIIIKLDSILDSQNNNRQAALFGLGGIGQVLFIY